MTRETTKIKPPNSSIRTAYAVSVGGKVIGHVWSYVGFSYRGTQGWNAGIRIEDFNPIEWRYCIGKIPYSNRDGSICYSRRQGVDRLIDDHEREAKS